tara:strand:+ start:84 stop:233 length:150 start_codon:yes stop_codon:yes gene_type:complete
LTALLFKKENSLIYKIKNKKDKSINKIFINEIVEPKIIEIGKKENKTIK